MEHSDTHREIVEACLQGDRRAQAELYRLYSGAMYNICLRMLNDPQEAEDLLQQSFLDVFTRLDKFRFESSIGAWIKRIVINNCINHLKKRRLQVLLLDEEQVAWLSEAETDEEPEPDYSIDAIKRAMKALPDGYRVVFSLYLFEGYDHQEIAEILHISEATSKSQYHRAKKKLRQLLTETDAQANARKWSWLKA